jgi:hypothetical protein
MKIGNAEIGVSQIKQEAHPLIKTIANTFIIAASVVACLVGPMPTDWIPNDVKVYILTVCGSGGILKVLEKLSGKVQPE